jgi:uncharacterized protein (UPF0332 family)
MKKPDFLDNLKKEGKLELVDPSDEIALSYEKKSQDCLQAAKLIFKAALYENAVGEAYYSIYNSIQSLFFKCGIKCESHGAAAVLLKRIFGLPGIYKAFSDAKEERIDKQYYVTPRQNNPVTDKSAQDLLSTADRFILEISAYKSSLKLTQIEEIRKRFRKEIGQG